MEINKLIGSRLRYVRERVGQSGDEFGKGLEAELGKKWNRQKVWEAERGDWDFRVADLVALARVTKVGGGVSFFLTAPGKGAAVELAAGGPPIPSAELADLFIRAGTAKDRSKEIKELRAQVAAAMTQLRSTDELLKWLQSDVTGEAKS